MWGVLNSKNQAWLVGTPGHWLATDEACCVAQINCRLYTAQPACLLPVSSTTCFLLYTARGTERPGPHGPRVLQPGGLCHILAQCLLGYDVMCSCLSPQSLVFPPINNSTIRQEHLAGPKAPLVTHPGPNPGFLESLAGGPSPFRPPVSAIWLLAKLVRKEPPHRVWY